MIFFGKIQKGKLVLNNIKKFNEFLATQKDQIVEIRIRKWRTKRSLQQNALYWMWLQVIAQDLGYDTEELHNSFRAMFLIDRGKKIPLVRSTTTLNRMEFTQYLDKIEREASQLDIVLPQPEEYYSQMDKEFSTG